MSAMEKTFGAVGRLLREPNGDVKLVLFPKLCRPKLAGDDQ
jgi:hypothetical protein